MPTGTVSPAGSGQGLGQDTEQGVAAGFPHQRYGVPAKNTGLLQEKNRRVVRGRAESAWAPCGVLGLAAGRAASSLTCCGRGGIPRNQEPVGDPVPDEECVSDGSCLLTSHCRSPRHVLCCWGAVGGAGLRGSLHFGVCSLGSCRGCYVAQQPLPPVPRDVTSLGPRWLPSPLPSQLQRP